MAELKVEQNEIGKLQINDLSYFFRKFFFFGDGGSQNMFVYQPTLDTLELQKEKGNDYVLSWKSKGLYPFELKPLYTAFLHSINFLYIEWK